MHSSRGRMAFALVLITVLAACGRESGDVSTRRVIVTPKPSATATPSPKATKTPAATRAATPAPAPRITTAPAPGSNLANAKIKLTQLATMNQPIAMALRPNDAAFYIAEKGGRVKVFKDGRVGNTILDISGSITTGSEQGLLGLAFSPDGKKMYVNFTDRASDTVIREYDFNGSAVSPRDVLKIDQPYANHNGGNIAFGPDGYLYIGMGDGGSGGDPHNNGQNLESLLGKMLRIDPDQSGDRAYTSPRSNPFVGKAGRDEIWSSGLRNPWRFTFDRLTKALWIADVGQNEWEEINADSAATDAGDNYGWRRMEGTHSFGGASAPSNYHGPIYEYNHDGGNCSVTGGYVYRGSKIRDLAGGYVFADFCVGRLRAFKVQNARAAGHRFLGPQAGNLASFGQDASGELYVLSLEGGFYRIDPA